MTKQMQEGDFLKALELLLRWADFDADAAALIHILSQPISAVLADYYSFVARQAEQRIKMN